jgi:hypothetical protein
MFDCLSNLQAYISKLINLTTDKLKINIKKQILFSNNIINLTKDNL